MQLYLIRHADAVPAGAEGIMDDASRSLSTQGKEQARAVGQGLTRRGIHLQALVSSPLLRARETAEGIAEVVPRPAAELQINEDLAPGGKRKRLSRFLQDLNVMTVALVGHQPDLGEFAAWLIGSKRARLDFAKAGVACIQLEDQPGKGSGTLTWLVTPELFITG